MTTSSRSLAKACQEHVLDWINASPPYLGPAWASGIEAAVRLVTIIAVTELTERVMGRDDAYDRAVRGAVGSHISWIQRFPSRYSSANNHRVAELAAVYLAGQRHPGLHSSAAAAGLLSELRQQPDQQFHPDGVGREQSPTYAAFTLEWLALCVLSSQDFDQGFVHRLADAAHAITAMTDSGGHVVRIGDDDEGRVLTAAVPSDRFLSMVVELLAGLPGSGRPDTKAPDALSVLADGGYTVSRTTERGSEALWVFDHGPLGMGGIAAHGHADCLAVWLHYGGQPLLVDAGTYLYHGSRGWRDYFRSTAAHNTVMLEGLDSSTAAGNFNWHPRQRATGVLDAVDRTNERWKVTAHHDGYRRRLGALLHRSLERFGDGEFAVEDWTSATTTGLRYRSSWLFASELEIARSDQGTWLVSSPSGRVVLAVTPPAGFEVHVLRGSDEPRGGWFSGAFGSLEPASQLIVQGTAEVGVPVRTQFELAP